jgi:diaminopimelate decarboxylase
MRPALYGSYHHISVLPHALSPSLSERETAAVVVGGPLCESGDVFTQQEGGFVAQRPLPQPVIDDLLVFHDTGAYGASMSSNYNSRPFSPEVLIDGKHTQLIRRRQTIAELLALEDTL